MRLYCRKSLLRGGGKLDLYEQKGWVNIPGILEMGLPFNIIGGGRGTGKSYGAIKFAVENHRKFIFMRRTGRVLQTIQTSAFSPFKKYNSDTGSNIGFSRLGPDIFGIYHMEKDDNGKDRPAGNPLGYLVALSTLVNVRGFDASDVDFIIYDECVKERHEKSIKGEGAAFLNAYETINRNREFEGRPPVQVLAFSNSIQLDNPLYIELGIVKKVESLQRKKQEIYIDRERGLGVFMLYHSPISEKKKETALYKLTGSSEYSRMALGNVFSEISENVGRRPLGEYRPVVRIGEVTIYQHKDAGRGYYVTGHNSGTPPVFTQGDSDADRFRRQYRYLWIAYMMNRMCFETSADELYFRALFKEG